VGKTLTADTSGLTNQSGTLHYQWISHNNDWEAGGDENVGSDEANYTPEVNDAGKYISVTVSSSGNSGSVKSNAGTNGGGCTGPVAAASLESLAAVLAALGDTTSAESPATIPLSGLNISDTWASIDTTVSESKKYVILDLSGCTATGNTIVSESYDTSSGNDFNIINKNSYIKGVILPDGLISIGDNAFSCGFTSNSNLTSVVIPDSVTSIGKYAFYNCAGITSIALPSGVTRIDDYAFRGCSNLEHITIKGAAANPGVAIAMPSSLVYIGTKAFEDCAKLAGSVIIPDGVEFGSGVSFYGCAGITGIIIESDISDIPASAFRGCASLVSITIPASVTSIGSNAFYDCTNLASVTIPVNVTSIETNTFYGCASLVSITIPVNVTSIGSGAFRGCASLAGITIPASVTSIGNSAFSGCTSLTGTIDLSHVKTLGNTVFGSSASDACTGITGVVLSDELTTIGTAFRYCSGLTSITIPASLTSIPENAFSGCTNLVTVVFAGDKTTKLANATTCFYNSGTGTTGLLYAGTGGTSVSVAMNVGTYTRSGSEWTKEP